MPLNHGLRLTCIFSNTSLNIRNLQVSTEEKLSNWSQFLDLPTSSSHLERTLQTSWKLGSVSTKLSLIFRIYKRAFKRPLKIWIPERQTPFYLKWSSTCRSNLCGYSLLLKLTLNCSLGTSPSIHEDLWPPHTAPHRAAPRPSISRHRQWTDSAQLHKIPASMHIQETPNGAITCHLKIGTKFSKFCVTWAWFSSERHFQVKEILPGYICMPNRPYITI